MARYPHPIPFGWFQVCWPDEVPTDGAYVSHNLGTTLTARRRGEGFTVTDGDGHRWPTMVRNGALLMWWHPQRAEPDFEVPAIAGFGDEAGFTAPIRRAHLGIKAFWQDLGETAVDVAHVQAHLIEFGLTMDETGAVADGVGRGTAPEVVASRWDGPHGMMRLSQPFPTPQGPVPGHVDSDLHGPGVALTRFSGLIDTFLLGCSTPIDTDRTDLRFTYVVRSTADQPVSAGLAEAFVNEVDRLAVDDLEIWEHKAYMAHPALALGDGPIMDYRRWAEQFYLEPTATSVSPRPLTRQA